MIQRIQTIHLLLSVIIGIVAEILSITAADGNVTVTAFAGVESVRCIYLALIALGILLALWSIFLFNKRMFQFKVVRFSTVAYALGIITLVVSAILNHRTDASWLDFAPLLPVVCIILNILASRRILFDERLVRSADRLR